MMLFKSTNQTFYIILVSGILLTLLTWYLWTVQTDQIYYQLLNEHTTLVEKNIRITAKDYVQAIKRMASRLVVNKETNYQNWLIDATHYINDLQALVLIQWVNTDEEIIWIAPYQYNSSLANNGHRVSLNTELVERAQREKDAVLSKPFLYSKKGIGMDIYCPVFINEKFKGTIKATFSLYQLFNNVLIDPDAMKYAIHVTAFGKDVYANFHNIDALGPYRIDRDFMIKGIPFKMTMYIDHSALTTRGIWGQVVILLFGLLFTVLLAFFYTNSKKMKYQEQHVSQSIHELSRLRNELEEETAKSIAANQIKRAFLSNMSHEIRTPMNGIMGAAKLLKSEELSDVQKEFVSIIDESANHLFRLITQLVDLAKLEAGKMELEASPVIFMDLVERVKHYISEDLKQKNLDFTYKNMATHEYLYAGDPKWLEELIRNLLENAVKFTTEGSINVNLFSLALDKDRHRVTLEVMDTGIGISEAHLDCIFDQFEQVESSSNRRFEGAGLGLTICQRIVAYMGGKISVISELGKGAVFRAEFELNVLEKYERKDDVMSKPKSNKRSYGKKVLVAEDNFTNRKLLETVLGSLDIEITTVDNGLKAIDRLKVNNEFDLILMDIEMPEKNGLVATKEIRAIGIETPILGLTAHIDTDVYENCLVAGMNGVISKPILLDDLVPKLDEWLSDERNSTV